MSNYYKDHKKAAIKILENVAKWMNESKHDYHIDDLGSLLREAKKHYEAYLELSKDNPNYIDKFENKSYK